MRQNCASGLPNPARFARHLFVCGRGRLNKFVAEMLGTLRKSSELESRELSINDSAPGDFAKNLGPESNNLTLQTYIVARNWLDRNSNLMMISQKTEKFYLCQD